MAAAAAAAAAVSSNDDDDIDRSESEICKKFSVKIFKPRSSSPPPKGITVFLPGTLMKLENYQSTYQILSRDEDHLGQIVVGFSSMNPFPIIGRSHTQMAKDVVSVIRELRRVYRNVAEYQHLSQSKYNIIGHSLGGKVALMVAAKYDIDNVRTIIALDPVDDRPQELTYPKPPQSPTTDLSNSKALAIHLFQSDHVDPNSWFPPLVPPTKNASVIQSMYPRQISSFKINKGAGHMSYLDTRSDDASVNAREDVHEKIRASIR
jgi:pimeloyl-ACP methyl ester carboxylesterase